MRLLRRAEIETQTQTACSPPCVAIHVERGKKMRHLKNLTVFVILAGFSVVQFAVLMNTQTVIGEYPQSALYAEADKPAPTDPKPKPPQPDPNAKPAPPSDDDGGCNC
jgi:hypothetical protein